MSKAATAILLAAGKGTRMRSAKPKVLHEVCNEPMLSYVFDACRNAGCDNLIGVIGFGADQVRSQYASATDISWVEQTEQLGTGHAVMMCLDLLKTLDGPVLVLAGDGPLVRSETLEELIKTHTESGAACTLATSILDDPAAYGRIIRDEAGELVGITEYLDASESQRAIREVNVSIYCFDAQRLVEVLGRLSNDNAKGEYYLTDALGLLRSAGHHLAAVAAVPAEDVLSINDRGQLAMVNTVMQQRIQARHMTAGVSIAQPSSTWISPATEIGPDTVIRPNTVLDGACKIGGNCVIGPFAHLCDAEVAEGETVSDNIS